MQESLFGNSRVVDEPEFPGIDQAMGGKLVDPPRMRLIAKVGEDDDVGDLADPAQRFERGESVPRIEGLPVMEVQLAGSRGDDSRPLMVVAQQLESGQVIRTIEGPATDV